MKWDDNDFSHYDDVNDEGEAWKFPAVPNDDRSPESTLPIGLVVPNDTSSMYNGLGIYVRLYTKNNDEGAYNKYIRYKTLINMALERRFPGALIHVTKTFLFKTHTQIDGNKELNNDIVKNDIRYIIDTITKGE